jgi:glutaminyl-tRNA synthetase
MYPIRSGLISKGSATVWKKFSRCFSEQLKKETATVATLPKNFITNIIENDLASGKTGGRVVTRFPPEPNGYLHIGHAKSINLNFELAQTYNGITNMRLDDTNPAKEDMEYVLSILDDVRWIVTGNTKVEPAPWNGSVKYASDYFPVIYDCAEYLIKQGMAYVDDLTTGK